jgi:lysophospholipase L1-like esterase
MDPERRYKLTIAAGGTLMAVAAIGLFHKLRRPTRIALIGDSLGVGLGPMLKKLWAPTPFRYEAYVGTTPAQWATHASACGQCGSWLASWQPSLTLIVLGTNDMGGTPNPAYYQSIVASVKATGSDAAWVEPPNMPKSALTAVRQTIESLDCIVVPAATIPIGSDEVHPTYAGYQQWAQFIVSALT